MNASEMHFNLLFNPFPIFTAAEATTARAGAASAAIVAWPGATLAWVVAKADAALALVEALQLGAKNHWQRLAPFNRSTALINP